MVLSSSNNYSKSHLDVEKVNNDIKDKLSSLNENDVSKDNLSKFLITLKLSEEILGE